MLTEDVVPAVGAAIACAIFALGLVLRQMARHEKLLREILRVHEELLETLLPELRKASRAPAVRGSAAGKDSDSEPWHGDTRASAVPAPRAGSRVPRAAAPPDKCRVEPVEGRSGVGTGKGAEWRQRSRSPDSSRPPSRGAVHVVGLSGHAADIRRSSSFPTALSHAGPGQIVASSSTRFSRCASGPADSRGLADLAAAGFSRCSSGSSNPASQQHDSSQSGQPRRPRSSQQPKISLSSGISSARPRPPAAASLSQHSAFACRRRQLSMLSPVPHCSCFSPIMGCLTIHASTLTGIDVCSILPGHCVQDRASMPPKSSNVRQPQHQGRGEWWLSVIGPLSFPGPIPISRTEALS